MVLWELVFKSSNELTRGLGTGKSLGRWGRGWETEENETSRDGAGNGRHTGKGGARDASGRQERGAGGVRTSDSRPRSLSGSQSQRDDDTKLLKVQFWVSLRVFHLQIKITSEKKKFNLYSTIGCTFSDRRVYNPMDSFQDLYWNSQIIKVFYHIYFLMPLFFIQILFYPNFLI